MRAAGFARPLGLRRERCSDPLSGATLLETLCVLHGYSLGLQMCHVFSGALIHSHRKRSLEFIGFISKVPTIPTSVIDTKG